MSARQEFFQLPVRPLQGEGESLSGWILRIYLANGYAAPQNLRGASKLLRTQSTLDETHPIFEFLTSSLIEKIHQHEAAHVEMWEPFVGRSWYAWTNKCRFCPVCFNELGYHMLHWDLPFMSACPSHGCQLSDLCHQCGLPWRWGNLARNWGCPCGAKVQDAPLRKATRISIRFSAILLLATDTYVPLGIKEHCRAIVPDHLVYRAKDTYEVLWWLIKMRAALCDRARSLHTLRKTPFSPAQWEVSCLVRLVISPRKSALHTIRWLLRNSRATLIDLDYFGTWRDVEETLLQLKVSHNPLAEYIHDTVRQTLDSISAHVSPSSKIHFNPRFPVRQIQLQRESLNRWWPRISHAIPALDFLDHLTPNFDLPNGIEGWKTRSTPSSAQLLNVMLYAAKLGLSSQAMGLLSKRWKLPENLRHPVDVITALGSYFVTLHESERLFVLAIFSESIRQNASSEKQEPCHA